MDVQADLRLLLFAYGVNRFSHDVGHFMFISLYEVPVFSKCKQCRSKSGVALVGVRCLQNSL